MKQEKSTIKVLMPIIVFLLGCVLMFVLISKYPDLLGVSLTKIEKKVSISDTGIAESVEKVYDSVVIVSVYQDDKPYGFGTGFVYKEDSKFAYILTNNHVVEASSRVTATFTDGKVVEANVVGSDDLSDIAVITVPKKDAISVANIGKSDDMKLGDTTFTVGAPLDNAYSWTVTRGILSGKDRMVEVSLSSGDYVMNVLQTDAAINSGNSGGPLCNVNGEVIGITSLKLVDESVEGMGFAIPIETAVDYAERIEKGEDIVQPYLGVSMLNLAEAYYYKEFYNIIANSNTDKGVIIVSVEKGSPAEKAGLQTGDIITKIGDKNVLSIGYLRYYLYTYRVGDSAKITYIRNGKEKTTNVKLGTNKSTY